MGDGRQHRDGAGRRPRARVLAMGGLAGLSLLLAGCSLPDGVDGDLVDGWRAMPELVGFVPDAGVCHTDEYRENAGLYGYDPVDCDQPHATETVHVGEFGADVASRSSPPEPGSSDWQSAFQQCEETAAAYLGADFRHGPLRLAVTAPPESAWEGGARWLRCEVMEVEGTATVERTGSLAGALTAPSDLAFGCFVITDDEDTDGVDQIDPADCDEPHNAEFVGVHFASGDSLPDLSDSDTAAGLHEGCRSVVAEFADVPDDDDVRFRTGTVLEITSAEDWDNGDRGVRCWMWLDRDVEKSLEGVGPSGLPVQ